MMRYFVHSWRYGEESVDEFDNIEDATASYECDTDECFVEKLVDSDGRVIRDRKRNVIGYGEE